MNRQQLEILGGIMLVIAVVAGVYFFAPQGPRSSGTPHTRPEVPQPEYTQEIAEALAKSNGFQHLVSYTADGFEPSELTVKSGETVRFVNNSFGALWVAATADGGRVYPANGTSCGDSTFDSCSLIQAGVFWEFTFDLPGTWTYKNNADIEESGFITVTVE